MSQFTSETTGAEIVKTFAENVRGKTILITGPSTNTIGGQAAIDLAAGKPSLLILAGRNKDRIQPVIDHIKTSDPDVEVKFVKVDLADLSSVREAAKETGLLTKKLDILINNAGVMAIKDYTTSKDGIEYQFAANHVGHFLLTNLLMDKLFAAGGGARIINVSSFGCLSGGVRFDDWNFKEGNDYNPWLAYAQSKTANILFAAILGEKLKGKGVAAFSLHPGLIADTNLQAGITPEMFQEGYNLALESLAAAGETMPDAAMVSMPLVCGTSTLLVAALDPSISDQSGAFLTNCAVWTGPLGAHARGKRNQDALQALSEKLVGKEFEFS
ncbi:hypothetical protein B0O99DRAFT_569733 [Bisporella sp. PMI_857]|nr:hypothetical protein B0O99DRAFT_569733 [Bisporella sp. PMI_857]